MCENTHHSEYTPVEQKQDKKHENDPMETTDGYRWGKLKLSLKIICQIARASWLLNFADCCIFWPAFGCCALQTLVDIFILMFFTSKSLKKLEKQKKQQICSIILQIFWKFAPKTLVECFIPRFFYWNKVFQRISASKV